MIPRKSKYRAIPTVLDGIRFASKSEAKRYGQLKLLQMAGEIRWFTCQVPFHLGAGVRYVCDFLIVYTDGQVEVEDVKGMETAMFKVKKKLFEAAYQPLVVVKNGRGK